MTTHRRSTSLLITPRTDFSSLDKSQKMLFKKDRSTYKEFYEELLKLHEREALLSSSIEQNQKLNEELTDKIASLKEIEKKHRNKSPKLKRQITIANSARLRNESIQKEKAVICNDFNKKFNNIDSTMISLKEQIKESKNKISDVHILYNDKIEDVLK